VMILTSFSFFFFFFIFLIFNYTTAKMQNKT
jgi:hypothetical protein